MIIVAGTMYFDPADIPAFHLATLELAGQVRAEDGCLHYALAPDDPRRGTVSVLEMWRDDAALKVHLGQPWVTAFLQHFGGKVKELDVKIYDVAGVRPFAL
jgi:quinol monooxygenase YgiN